MITIRRPMFGKWRNRRVILESDIPLEVDKRLLVKGELVIVKEVLSSARVLVKDKEAIVNDADYEVLK